MQQKSNRWILNYKVVHVLLLTSSMIFLPQDLLAAKNKIQCDGIYGNDNLQDWNQTTNITPKDHKVKFETVEVDSAEPKPLSNKDFVLKRTEKPVKNY